MRESEGAILPSTLLSGEMSCQIGLVTYSAVNLWTLPNTSQGVGILPRQCTHPDMGRDGISRFFFWKQKFRLACRDDYYNRQDYHLRATDRV